jgi:chromosome segregation ATPase
MFKKLALTALAVLAGLFILNNTRLGSYGHTAWGKIKHSAKAQVPLEFELERVKQQVAMLVPDMKNHLSDVANEIVAIDNLKEEIKVAQTNLTKQKEFVRCVADDLKSGAERIALRGRVYTRTRASDMLSQEVSSCKRLEEEIKAREQLLEHKERALESTREQLSSIKTQRQELEVEIARLEAELKSVRLAQTKSKIQLDDSRLAHIKSSLADIRNRLKVDKVTADLANQFAGEQEVATPRPTKSANDVVQEAEAYLSGGTAPTAVASEKKQ